MKARELGRKGVVVGDRVALVGDLAGRHRHAGPDRAGRAAQRPCCGARADDDDPFERVLVANADQLVDRHALADPEPRPRMIDRCLVAAYDAGLDPLLVLTKSDLAPAGRAARDVRRARRAVRGDAPRRPDRSTVGPRASSCAAG